MDSVNSTLKRNSFEGVASFVDELFELGRVHSDSTANQQVHGDQAPLHFHPY